MSTAVEVTELQELLARLEAGLDRIPHDESRTAATRWRDRMSAGSSPEHSALAAALGELLEHLNDPDRATRTLGEAYAAVGERALAAAPLAGEAAGPVAARLGHYLYHAGHAMRGAAPD
jgi:hypothetical protein